MKKTFLSFLAVYLLISIFAINAKITSLLSAEAAIGDYPIVQCISLTSDLIFGSTDQNTHNQVTLLQLFLTQKGYEIGRDSFGTFGYGTKDAVASFQKNNGLIPTGFVGSHTIALIKDISCHKKDWANYPATRQIAINSGYNCGINNGLIWNGSECVNTCDKNHPWNPKTQRCSIDQDYLSGNFHHYSFYSDYNPQAISLNYPNGNFANSCQSAYGESYFWNGKYCVQAPNQNYCGNSQDYFWNGSHCSPKYITQYLCSSNGQYYDSPNLCPSTNSNQNHDYLNIYDQLDLSQYFYEVDFRNHGYYDIYGIYHRI